MSATAAAKALGPDAKAALPKPKSQPRRKVPEAAPPMVKPTIQNVAITEDGNKEGKLGKGKSSSAKQSSSAKPKSEPRRNRKKQAAAMGLAV